MSGRYCTSDAVSVVAAEVARVGEEARGPGGDMPAMADTARQAGARARLTQLGTLHAVRRRTHHHEPRATLLRESTHLVCRRDTHMRGPGV